MESRAKFLGHAIHPMLVVFPLGVLVTAVAFDVLYLLFDSQSFAVASAFAIAAGILGGLGAALFGWVDWFAIPPGTRAKRIALFHGLANVAVLVLFTVSWLARFAADDWTPARLAIVLGLIGVAVAGAGGWLGGELVQRLGVSIHPGAGLDAPSSLSLRGGDEPAREEPSDSG